jgi:hypothetical protein
VNPRVLQVAFVQEDIRPTTIGLNETKATIGIPPYQRADRQDPPLSLLRLLYCFAFSAASRANRSAFSRLWFSRNSGSA